MSSIQIEEYPHAVLLRLAKGVTSPINLALVNDLAAAVADIKQHHQGVVIAGGDKFFSIGLDIPTMIKTSPEEFSEFWNAFNQLLFDIYTLPMPTICAMRGNTIAGGTVLALTCDYRYGADNGKKMGLNEIKLGVPIPYLTSLTLPRLVSDHAVRDIIYGGEFFSFNAAHKDGLVDNIYPAAEVEARALEKVSSIAQRPKAAFQTMKATHIEAVVAAYLKNHKTKNAVFADMMFAEPARSKMIAAAENF